ncbi:hypothetical protein FGRMN_1932 [Fusarium graminum]|nr:hypothetical protein FGRMN_1932 [Fusarium graminum]
MRSWLYVDEDALSTDPTGKKYHGERGESDGKAIKWQQLAQGVFTGVPAKDWNDKIHKHGFQELDIEELISSDRNISSSEGYNLELAERNIPD